MHLFYIRNSITLFSAYNIIEQNKMNNALAVFHFGQIMTKEYKSIYKNIIIKKYWSEINYDFINTFNGKYFFLKHSPKKIKSFFETLATYYQVKLYLNEKKVESIYLSTLRSNEERIIYSAASNLKIKINLMEEGFSNYYNKKATIKKSRLIKFAKIIIFNVFFLRDSISPFDSFNYNSKFNSIYTSFQNLNIYKNYNKMYFNKLKIILPSRLEKKFQTLNINDYTLYVSQPLSEGGEITLSSEIEALHKINKIHDKIIFKSHPRDSKSKLSLIQNKFPNIVFECILDNIPAEYIFKNVKLSSVVGIYSSSLIYSSEIFNIPTISYINFFSQDFENMYLIQQTLKEKFKSIVIAE